MTTTPKINRRGWLATWAQGRRRARRAANVPPVTLRTGLAAYWPLDEAAGLGRADVSGNGWDLSEFSFEPDWATNPAVIGQTPGVVDNAAVFSDWVGWCLLAPSGPDLGAGDFSLACWFNYTSDWYDNQALFYCGQFAAGIRPFEYRVWMSYFTDQPETWSGVASPEFSLNEGTWTHCVFVKAGATFRVYLNGADSGNLGTQTGAAVLHMNDLRLGIYDAGYPLNGALDEVGLWQRALSAAEVAQLYNYGDGLPYDWF
jgi:hypothetical protein